MKVRKGMPIGSYTVPRKQTLVEGTKVTVVSKRHMSSHCGWKMKAVNAEGNVIYDSFHNGKGFSNPFDIDEAMLVAIKKYLDLKGGLCSP